MSQTKNTEQQEDLQSLLEVLSGGTSTLPLDASQAFLNKYPDFSEGYFILGIQSFLAGYVGDAIEMIEKAHVIDPGVREYAEALSSLYSLSGRLNDALYYAKIISVTQSHEALAALLPPQLKDFVQAAGEVQPHQNYINASLAYNRREFDLVIEECQLQLKMTPSYLPVLELYGKTLIEVGEYGPALPALQDVVILDPNCSASVYLLLADAFYHLALYEKAHHYIKEALHRGPDSVDIMAKAYQMLANMPCMQAASQALLADFRESVFRDNQPYYPYVLPEGEKIHVGFLSDKFYNCVEGRALSSLVTKLDNRVFRTFGYIQNYNSDSLTQALKNMMESARESHDINDKTLALIMSRDRIDILIDMCGFGDGQRLSFIAKNPCGIRLSWLAQPHGGGQPGVQYVLTDDSTNESQTQLLGKDQGCLHISPPLFAHAPIKGYGDVAPSPLEKNKALTFGVQLDLRAFVEHGALYKKLLDSIPGSKLCISIGSDISDMTIGRLNEIFAPFDLLEKIELSAPDDEERLGGFFDQVDIYLPSIFEDISRLEEALYMGVPCILKVDQSEQRVNYASTVLRAIGSSSWVCDFDDDVVKTVQVIIADPEKLKMHRATLREQIEQSELMNMDHFVMGLQRKLIEQFGGHFSQKGEQ